MYVRGSHPLTFADLSKAVQRSAGLGQASCDPSSDPLCLLQNQPVIPPSVYAASVASDTAALAPVVNAPPQWQMWMLYAAIGFAGFTLLDMLDKR